MKKVKAVLLKKKTVLQKKKWYCRKKKNGITEKKEENQTIPIFLPILIQLPILY